MDSLPARYDIAVIGAGMSGASLAAELAPHARVVLIEAESQPGYHSTGRSAAFWTETYGGPAVAPLTNASGPFLDRPPADFADATFLTPRGALHVADTASQPALDALLADFAGSGITLTPVDRAGLEVRLPGLRAGWERGVAEPSCADIDVAALHAAYLRAARRAGAVLLCDSPLLTAERADVWRIRAGAHDLAADILVDAAGAWADPVARLAGVRPLGIRPYRRTIAQLRIDPPAADDLPLVIDAAGRFYFKPVPGGRLWLSPHDETPQDAADAAPEDLDIAIAIDRLQGIVDWRVARIEHRWAGLRSFAPDRLPVYGFDSAAPGFFWFAGQGGFGIQTAPAAAKLGAALLLARPPEPMVAAIDAAAYAPDRTTLNG